MPGNAPGVSFALGFVPLAPSPGGKVSRKAGNYSTLTSILPFVWIATFVSLFVRTMPWI
jgi:hypothetical protein